MIVVMMPFALPVRVGACKSAAAPKSDGDAALTLSRTYTYTVSDLQAGQQLLPGKGEGTVHPFLFESI